jgi:hypothetical protein
MPIFRYFVLVGSCLLALLFAADRFLPRPIDGAAADDVDRSVIRIRSARVGPEKIEFDTAHPPSPLPMIREEPRDARPRESYAMMPAAAPPQPKPMSVSRQSGRRPTTHVTRGLRRPPPPERRIALDHPGPSAW